MPSQHHPTQSLRASRRSVLAALGSIPIAATGAFAITENARADDDPPRRGRIPDELRPGGEFDRYVAELAAEDKFSGTLLLTYRGRTVLERAYRMADKKRRVPNQPETRFSLGSNTKMFTGVAISQLAQQGKLAYHEKLGAYLYGFAPEIADQVTIHHLLTHTSGLGDYHQIEGFVEESRTWHSVEEAWNGVMSYVRKDKLTFTPGAGSAYSNTGYVVLGAIVAAISGQSYYDYIREHVFRPAGMTDAAFHTAPQWHEDRRIAHPYATGPSGRRVDAIDRHLFVGMPAGGSFASTRDMARFADALQNDKLLDPAFTRIMLSPKLPRDPDETKTDTPAPLSFVGYGSLVSLDSGHWVLGHGGGSPGVSASLAWFPDSGWVAVVHSNYDSGAEPVAGLARELILSKGVRL